MKKVTKRLKARARQRARTRDRIVQWGDWLALLMFNDAADAMTIRNLFTHFRIGSEEDTGPKLREACKRALRLILWHPGFPLFLAREGIKFDPEAIVHTPSWMLNLWVDPRLEPERLAYIKLRDEVRKLKADHETFRRGARSVLFSLNYEAAP